jgi:hypothetical protein
MSTISAASALVPQAMVSGSQAAPSLAALQSQADILERKYSDICGCQTTPRDEKQKQEAKLSQQLSSIHAQIAALQQQAPTHATVQGSDTGNQTGDTLGRPAGAVGLRPLVDDKA